VLKSQRARVQLQSVPEEDEEHGDQDVHDQLVPEWMPPVPAVCITSDCRRRAVKRSGSDDVMQDSGARPRVAV